MDYTADWSYAGLAPERSDHLRNCPPYCELIRQLADKVGKANIEFHLDEGRYAPVDAALRPIFYVEVGEDVADRFFNGVSGYRAQYYASPGNGLDANRYAFRKLERHLLLAAQKANFRIQAPNESTRELLIPEMDLLLSLRLASAKIWGDETEDELHIITTQRQDVTAQVIAPRWIDNAKYGSEKARKGIKAPRFKTLKIHGAFLKGTVEQVPLEKLTRSEDIHFWGFS
jgi:hypothetical protein